MGGNIGYCARKETPQGNFVNATGTLSQKDIPGHFEQQLYFYGIPGPKVDYNVIYIDEEAAIEYDCSDSFIFGYNYCVHNITDPYLISRKSRRIGCICRKPWTKY